MPLGLHRDSELLGKPIKALVLPFAASSRAGNKSYSKYFIDDVDLYMALDFNFRNSHWNL